MVAQTENPPRVSSNRDPVIRTLFTLIGKSLDRAFTARGLGNECGVRVDESSAAWIEPIVAPAPPELVAGDVDRLPGDRILAESGHYRVYYSMAVEIPNLLHEIGRQREISHRAAGEGMGKASDLDIYDLWYLHLVVWNVEKKELVGACRLGATDTILRDRGISGLHTARLYNFKPAFFGAIGPALELGKLYIRPEYQRSSTPLTLLWNGIYAYVARNPQYRSLFGAVNIGRSYTDASRRIVIDCLATHRGAEVLAGAIRTNARYAPKRPTGWNARIGSGLISGGRRVVRRR